MKELQEVWNKFIDGLFAILPYLALFMLGLSASYGVYQFALLYVPYEVAVITAASFELTYIGLSSVPIRTQEDKDKAAWVARGAVFVSVTYNVISGYLHRVPDASFSATEAVLAVLHGSPLAIVAYLLSELLIHSKKSSATSTVISLGKASTSKGNATSESGEHLPSVTIENLPQHLLPSGETSTEQKKAIARELKELKFTQEQIAQVLNVSRQRVGQLLRE